MVSSRNTAEQLARLHKEKALTQEALGKLAGTTGRYINCLEHGKLGSIVVWARIAAALDVLLEELYR